MIAVEVTLKYSSAAAGVTIALDVSIGSHDTITYILLFWIWIKVFVHTLMIEKERATHEFVGSSNRVHFLERYYTGFYIVIYIFLR